MALQVTEERNAALWDFRKSKRMEFFPLTVFNFSWNFSFFKTFPCSCGFSLIYYKNKYANSIYQALLSKGSCPLVTEISQGDGKSHFVRRSTVFAIKVILADFKNRYKNNSQTSSLKRMQYSSSIRHCNTWV